jgi:predicted DNA-binding protein (MmcQ/YjbR family)
VLIDDVPDGEVFELIDDSYDQVVAGLPKAKRPS